MLLCQNKYISSYMDHNDKGKHMFPPMCYVFWDHSIENIFRPLFLKYLRMNNENFQVAIWFFDNYLNVLMASRIWLRIPKHKLNFEILNHTFEFNFNFKLFPSWIHSRLSITFFSVYQKVFRCFVSLFSC